MTSHSEHDNRVLVSPSNLGLCYETLADILRGFTVYSEIVDEARTTVPEPPNPSSTIVVKTPRDAVAKNENEHAHRTSPPNV
ncbi:MAG: hypothetical protein AUI93_01730 [Crenarchaeota archaeon 13_1_40CM_3_52_10]|nr:MAG: hypothetical protein AUI93_01730 [Crenarchaeota archaeon 13_1_40CM_3_52_10]